MRFTVSALRPLLLLTVMVLATATRAAATEPERQTPPPSSPSGRYVINLSSSIQPAALPLQLQAPPFNQYRLYRTSWTLNGKRWHRLRLGLFADPQAAAAVLEQLRERYPQAWVAKASLEESEQALEPQPQPQPRFALNLHSQRSPITDVRGLVAEPFTRYRHYQTQGIRQGEVWYRLRLGFFTTSRAAEEVKQQLADVYPSAWVTRVATAEWLAHRSEPPEPSPAIPVPAIATVGPRPVPPEPTAAPPVTPTAAPPIAPTPVPPLPSKPEASPLRDDLELQGLMSEAEQAISDEDYVNAITLLSKILGLPEHAYSQRALELFGLALELSGRGLEQANIEYEKYLERYPLGEGADRVRQRLAALTGAAQPSKETAEPEQAAARWDVYGGFSQFFRHESNRTEVDQGEVSRFDLTTLSSDLDFTARLRRDDLNIRSRFSGSYFHDFLDREFDSINFRNLYIDVRDSETRDYIRVGRQSLSDGGVLQRFDGGRVGHYFTDSVRLNLVAGFPIASTTITRINTDKRFYGLNADLGIYADAWNFNLFAIEQRVRGILDRQAIGGEARYFKANRSFFMQTDYDTSFEEFNSFFFLGNWRTKTGRSYNLTLDHGNDTALTTSNALVGRTESSLSELFAQGFSEDQVRQLAQDRTATRSAITLGILQPIIKQLQVSMDFSVAELSSTPASGGVLATEGTGTEFSYFIQATGSDLIKRGDIAILGLRYTDGDDSDLISLNLNTRYPTTRSTTVNPRLRVDYRDSSDLTQWTLRPSVRLTYRAKKPFTYDFEVGGKLSSSESSETRSESDGYFLTMGYRADF